MCWSLEVIDPNNGIYGAWLEAGNPAQHQQTELTSRKALGSISLNITLDTFNEGCLIFTKPLSWKQQLCLCVSLYNMCGKNCVCAHQALYVFACAPFLAGVYVSALIC